jgi:hypothetical protein
MWAVCHLPDRDFHRRVGHQYVQVMLDARTSMSVLRGISALTTGDMAFQGHIQEIESDLD